MTDEKKHLRMDDTDPDADAFLSYRNKSQNDFPASSRHLI